MAAHAAVIDPNKTGLDYSVFLPDYEDKVEKEKQRLEREEMNRKWVW
jgi:hypothetical protein